ncbi:hypothetical protein OWR29_32455 [Actinoplanes sp. Pm04-4]|uniref:Uncharacterized protein n=1 Tax=Paractinoplanes pyxinae TaxID=2997416 RepID=A0ABT4B894_9ACTN|nr:hypothetical protein [Actinoplanes pyxinae]MCY1142731.1 hypothetical protein [Actinoplanes pyxinae]
MAFGLPIAVAVGWNLAVPAQRPAAVGVPGGEGMLGAAPAPAGTEPVAVRYSARPYRPMPSTSTSLSTSAIPIPSTPVPATTSSAVVVTSPATPSTTPTEVTEVPLPPLDEPPVPTPTDPGPGPGPSDPSGPREVESPSSAPTAEFSSFVPGGVASDHRRRFFHNHP